MAAEGKDDMGIVHISGVALLVASLVGGVGLPRSTERAGQPPSGRCAELPAARWLDFWVGAWTVRVGDQHVGASRIERVLDGCALIEHWEDARGGAGKSLFYLAPPNGIWHQVWVTNRAAAPGGVKEKRLIARYPDGAVRLQGEVATTDGLVLDRTTLSPLADGSVRQLIETSRDGGATWAIGFDALYRSASSPPASGER